MTAPPARLLNTHTQLLLDRSEPTGTSWLEAAAGRIAARGTGRPPTPTEDMPAPDATGATVMPGPSDALVHWHPPDPRWQGAVLDGRARGASPAR